MVQMQPREHFHVAVESLPGVCCGREEERHFRPKEDVQKLKSQCGNSNVCNNAMSVVDK